MWCKKCGNGDERWVPRFAEEVKNGKEKEIHAVPCINCGSTVYTTTCPFPNSPSGMGSGNATGKTQQKREGKSFYDGNPNRRPPAKKRNLKQQLLKRNEYDNNK